MINRRVTHKALRIAATVAPFAALLAVAGTASAAVSDARLKSEIRSI